MLSVQHFQDLLGNERAFITGQCEKWQKVLDDHDKATPDEACARIQVAVGQAQLLIHGKLKQFDGLLEKCGKGHEREMTVNDLQGFWEVMYIQVQDIHKRFSELDIMKSNNWNVIPEPERQPLAAMNKDRLKVSGRGRKPISRSNQHHAAQARERLAQVKASMKQMQGESFPENIGVML